MKKIKITNYGWWSVFSEENNLMHKILNENFDLINSKNADYLLCSVFGNEYEKFKGIRILQSGENICPNFNIFDYAIGFEYLEFGDRYYRCPNWIMNLKYTPLIQKAKCKHFVNEQLLAAKKEFCSFVYSNANANKMRENLFINLEKYNHVNSGGRYLNNIGKPIENKYEFEKLHKFSIVCENSAHSGYNSEKLIEAFASQTIPIYWGDPDINLVFNEKAFINVAKYNDIGDVIELIKEIDTNEEVYVKMIKEPMFINMNYDNNIALGLEQFLINIMEQKLEFAYRRNKI